MSIHKTIQSATMFIFGLIVSGVFSVSCSPLSPPPKLTQYLGDGSPATNTSSLKSVIDSHQELRIGLLPVFDTSEVDSAPPLSDEGRTRFLSEMIQRTESMLPWKVVEVVQGENVKPGKGVRQFVRPTRGKDLGGVLVVLISSTESQTPAYLHSAPDVGSIPGFQTQNFSLVEIALLEPSGGNPLLQTQGRAYATLEHLADPFGSNRYPNVRRSSQEGPIYPQSEKAHEVLRMVALTDALYQALWKCKEQWNNS